MFSSNMINLFIGSICNSGFLYSLTFFPLFQVMIDRLICRRDSFYNFMVIIFDYSLASTCLMFIGLIEYQLYDDKYDNKHKKMIIEVHSEQKRKPEIRQTNQDFSI